ncbi:RibD family protein [Enterocloster bolteae]|uniref:RibD family protein n=1 Tax=Enterocloster bolteae TaxID=208479 RepID=UPI00210A3FA6|nr:RibD family protein [Enterocloster bolteae]MCQ5144526.1 RibD family protein [Enterocloster bolteae]
MNRPYVICHMLTSLDGKIDGAFMSDPACAPALTEYGNIRNFYNCEATLYGTTTMAGGYSDGLAGRLPHSAVSYPKEDYATATELKNYIISVDPEGILGWCSNCIQKKNRPTAHVIEVLTETVSNDYLAYLRSMEISYIFAGKERLDCGVLLGKLKQIFSIERLLVAGGGMMNWSFLQDDLLDELSLVIAPVADGDTMAVSIFEKAYFLPARKPAVFELKGFKQIEGGSLWLRYMLKG